MTEALLRLLGFARWTAPYWATFTAALALSLLLTPVCRELARRCGMVDTPSARRINTVPVPRGGGLAIYLSLAAVLCAGVSFSGWAGHGFARTVYRLTALGGALCLVGLADDKFNLPPLAKLAGQAAVAVGAHVWGGVRFGILFPMLPAWLDCAFTVFWITGAINAFNLIDGLDGLATGLATIAAAGLAGALFFAGMPEGAPVYFAFIGACLGFLRYNFNPASVFLGDTGSMFLGFVLSCAPLVSGTPKTIFVGLGIPILAMGVPVFDTALAILRRTIRAAIRRVRAPDGGDGLPHVMQADTDHIHHRLLRRFASQRAAAMSLYGLATFLVAVGLGGIALKSRAMALYIVAAVAVAVVMVRDMRRVELWDMGRLLNLAARAPSRAARRRLHTLAVPLLLGADLAVLLLSWLFVASALSLPLTGISMRRWLPISVIPCFLCLVFFRAYQTAWRSAKPSNYVRLAAAVVFGALVKAAAVEAVGMPHSHLFIFTCFHSTLSFLGLLAVRALRPVARDIFYALDSGRLADSPGTTRLLVYGAGLRYSYFRRELVRSAADGKRTVVGILDDDVLLSSQYIGGIRIHGPLERAPEIVRALRADAIVVACRMTPARRRVAAKIFARCGVPVTEFVCGERDFTDNNDTPDPSGEPKGT